MRTYVLFHKKTGDIIHTHTEAAASGEPLPVSSEDLIAMYRSRPGAELKPQDLDVLEVEEQLLRRGSSNRKNLYVDVERQVLSERQ